LKIAPDSISFSAFAGQKVKENACDQNGQGHPSAVFSGVKSIFVLAPKQVFDI